MTMSATIKVQRQVAAYLDATEKRYLPGEDEYYVRAALTEALRASQEGNYGIGAVVTVAENGRVQEFRARSAMVTATGVVDHAETRGLLAVLTEEPFAEYRLAEDIGAMPHQGLSVYGTLEPCPLCTCAMINAGTIRSVSAVLDGQLVEEGGLLTTDGSANAIGDKRWLQPRVWRQLQDAIGLVFERLSTTDSELVRLCWEIFAVGRVRVDGLVAERGPLHHRHDIQA